MKKMTMESILTTLAVCAAYDVVKFAAKKGYEYLKFQEAQKRHEDDDEDFDDDFDFDDFDDLPGSGDTNYEKVSTGEDAMCVEDDEDPLEGLDIYLNGPKKEEKDGNSEKEDGAVHDENGDESGEGNPDNSAGNDNSGDTAGDDGSGKSESVENKEDEKDVQ